jgi:hypothetical protein
MAVSWSCEVWSDEMPTLHSEHRRGPRGNRAGPVVLGLPAVLCWVAQAVVNFAAGLRAA